MGDVATVSMPFSFVLERTRVTRGSFNAGCQVATRNGSAFGDQVPLVQIASEKGQNQIQAPVEHLVQSSAETMQNPWQNYKYGFIHQPTLSFPSKCGVECVQKPECNPIPII